MKIASLMTLLLSCNFALMATGEEPKSQEPKSEEPKSRELTEEQKKQIEQITTKYKAMIKDAKEEPDFMESIKKFNEAITYQPTLLDAHIMVASLLTESKKNDGPALTQWKTIISIDPTFAEAYDTVGLLLAKQKKWTESVTAHAHAVNLKPSDFKMTLGAGNAIVQAQAAGDKTAGLDAAMKLYKMAQSIKPDDNDVKVNIEILQSKIDTQAAQTGASGDSGDSGEKAEL